MKAKRGFIQNYIHEVKNTLDSLNVKKIKEVIDIIDSVNQNKGRIFIIGNGGSAATASHMSCDLGKSTILDKKDKKRFKVVSIADNSAVITAIANDFSYDEIFKQQLLNLSKPNDLLIVFSASGNSKNVIKAALYAKANHIKTIGFLGFKNGGKLAKLVDCAIISQSNNYGVVEDTHLILNHIITYWFSSKGKNI